MVTMRHIHGLFENLSLNPCDYKGHTHMPPTWGAGHTGRKGRSLPAGVMRPLEDALDGVPIVQLSLLTSVQNFATFLNKHNEHTTSHGGFHGPPPPVLNIVQARIVEKSIPSTDEVWCFSHSPLVRRNLVHRAVRIH